MIKKTLSFFILLLLVSACKSGKDQANGSKSSNAYKAVAEQALGEPIVYLFNMDSTYVMCQHLQDKMYKLESVKNYLKNLQSLNRRMQHGPIGH